MKVTTYQMNENGKVTSHTDEYHAVDIYLLTNVSGDYLPVRDVYAINDTQVLHPNYCSVDMTKEMCDEYLAHYSTRLDKLRLRPYRYNETEDVYSFVFETEEMGYITQRILKAIYDYDNIINIIKDNNNIDIDIDINDIKTKCRTATYLYKAFKSCELMV